MSTLQQMRIDELEESLQCLVTAARYAVNRLDSTGDQPQVSADLAIALACVEARTKIVARFS